jgi:Icc-related predicted phosphoesterase
MRVLAVADFASPAPSAGVDLILSCGDLPPEHLAYLARSLDAPAYYVRGNHDLRRCEREPEGLTDLHCRLELFRGLRLAGFEGSRWYNGGPRQYTEDQMRGLARRMAGFLRAGVDIVVTHAPPLGVHDREDPCHRGFQTFRRLITRYAPAWFLHGHVHASFQRPAERITIVGGTRVVNCSGCFLFETGNENGPA